MNEFLYEFADAAVSPGNMILTLALTLIGSLVFGLFIKNRFQSLVGGIATFVLTEVVCLLIFLLVRGEVHQERLHHIENTMSAVRARPRQCNVDATPIRKWKQGIELISRCPLEIGYYAKTADLLIKKKDYEAAATLIELGLDFLQYDPPPDPLCSRLKLLYELLPNRTKINTNCRKYHNL